MRERPIIFNADMVRAVLNGSKTQTRRIIQERHLYSGGREAGNWPVHMPEGEEGEKARLWAVNNSPFGALGGRLWVREAFAAFDADWCFPGRPHDLKDGPWPNIIYPADGGKELPKGTCRPSIHMPRWASRITLEITGVRVERLQDISHRDACREGLFREEYNWRENEFPLADIAYRTSPTAKTRYSCPKQCFQELWESIYTPESWQSNPWVWVIEFKRVEGE